MWMHDGQHLIQSPPPPRLNRPSSHHSQKGHWPLSVLSWPLSILNGPPVKWLLFAPPNWPTVKWPLSALKWLLHSTLYWSRPHPPPSAWPSWWLWWTLKWPIQESPWGPSHSYQIFTTGQRRQAGLCTKQFCMVVLGPSWDQRSSKVFKRVQGTICFAWNNINI